MLAQNTVSVPANKALVHRKILPQEVFFPHICGRSTSKDKQCKNENSQYTSNILDIVDSVKIVLGTPHWESIVWWFCMPKCPMHNYQ